jgi:hypothetical protein
MIDAENVYISYQQARARFLNRPYKIPTKWDTVWERMSEVNSENIRLITIAFNTRWQNIVMDKYFDYGFELFGKRFTYTKFFDKRLMNMYIEKDKQVKRLTENIKKSMEESFSFIEGWMKAREYRKDLSLHSQYGRILIEGMRAPIKHYIMNEIDKHTLTWLIYNKYVILEDYEKGLIPLVISNYRKFVRELKEYDGKE